MVRGPFRDTSLCGDRGAGRDQQGAGRTSSESSGTDLNSETASDRAVAVSNAAGLPGSDDELAARLFVASVAREVGIERERAAAVGAELDYHAAAGWDTA
jgi:hypothetical protein